MQIFATVSWNPMFFFRWSEDDGIGASRETVRMGRRAKVDYADCPGAANREARGSRKYCMSGAISLRSLA